MKIRLSQSQRRLILALHRHQVVDELVGDFVVVASKQVCRKVTLLKLVEQGIIAYEGAWCLTSEGKALAKSLL